MGNVTSFLELSLFLVDYYIGNWIACNAIEYSVRIQCTCSGLRKLSSFVMHFKI